MATISNGASAPARDPNDFIASSINKGVIVKLGSGADYRGTLVTIDGEFEFV